MRGMQGLLRLTQVVTVITYNFESLPKEESLWELVT